jgi:hypothetical protein
MTSAEMLARLRTLLDETPEGFWEDDEDCYPALSLAQLEVVKTLAPFKSMALRPIKERSALTAQSFAITDGLNLAADFYMIWSVRANAIGGTQKPAYERIERNDYEDNPYLSSENDRLYYSISGDASALKIFFEKTFINGSITMDYIIKPPDIDSEGQPSIDGIAHNAIVYYAFAYLLQKAKLPSAEALAMYDNAIKTLI